jgi:hypothetical protein
MDLLAAQRSTTTEPEPTLLAFALVIVAAAAALAVIVTRATAPRRPRTGPARMDLAGPESPALVGLLIDRFEVPTEAAAATLVDLAARGWLDIDQFGEDRIVVRVRSRPPTDDVLAPYERQVLRHVQSKAVDGVAPAGSLTTGADHHAQRWWRGFCRAIEQEAKQRGLARARWTRVTVGLLWVAVVAALAMVFLAFELGEEVLAGEATVNPLGGVALAGAVGLGWYAGHVTRTPRLRDTDAGLALAGAWMGTHRWFEDHGDFSAAPAASVVIWDRNLAYATAFGLATTVDRELPLGQECDRRAWSNATGAWRQVRVRYPRLRPAWGLHPFRALLSGLIQTAVFGGVAVAALLVWTGNAKAFSDLELEAGVVIWVERAALVAMLVLGPLALYAAIEALLGLVDLFPRRTVEGLVLRARARRQGDWLPAPVQRVWYSGSGQHRHNRHSGASRWAGVSTNHHRRVVHWLAVDDGHGSVVRAHRVRPGVYGRAPQGARVRLRVSPLLGYVTQVELLAPPPRPDPAPAPAPITQPPVAPPSVPAPRP